ncbi:MAG: NlpC/P60 family protein [Microlunatus sp.]|nr:NlpC/P60 family protein [Microlunatus sp.]MDN5769945.1 NlpC/P60 family protein [Microlunatus sp.]
MTSCSSEAVQNRGRLRRLVRNGALGLSALALTGTLLSVPSGAQADPPLTVEEAKAQVAQLETEAAAIDQEFVGVKQKLTQSKTQLKRKRTDVKTQTKKVERLRLQAGQVALAQFQNRQLDAAAKLLLSEDSDDFLSQISTVEKVSQNQNSSLQDYQEEQANLADLERATETDTAQLKKERAELNKLRTTSEDKIAESKTVLAKLTEEERQRIAAEEKKAREEARAAAERAKTATQSRSQSNSKSRSNSKSQSNSTSNSTSGSTSSGSGKGSTALAFAKSQLGKPYQFASAGPNSYDCSGLTYAAWKTQGVSLPRTSQTQYGAGRSVSKSELQPGDLVFYYGGISHVGLYAGNGQIIHSPRPGKSVEYASLDSMPFAGARRPG